MRHTHNDFQPFLASEWNKEANLTKNLQVVTAAFYRWNNEVFGHLKHRKSWFLGRLVGIHRT